MPELWDVCQGGLRSGSRASLEESYVTGDKDGRTEPPKCLETEAPDARREARVLVFILLVSV